MCCSVLQQHWGITVYLGGEGELVGSKQCSCTQVEGRLHGLLNTYMLSCKKLLKRWMKFTFLCKVWLGYVVQLLVLSNLFQFTQVYLKVHFRNSAGKRLHFSPCEYYT